MNRLAHERGWVRGEGAPAFPKVADSLRHSRAPFPTVRRKLQQVLMNLKDFNGAVHRIGCHPRAAVPETAAQMAARG